MTTKERSDRTSWPMGILLMSADEPGEDQNDYRQEKEEEEEK
jgi:hypothetical protein